MESVRFNRLPVALAAAVTLSLSAGAIAGDDKSESLIKRGFEIVPQGVQLNLAGKNRALVGLGSYIVNTGGCNDCHTHPSYLPNGNPFLGQPEMILQDVADDRFARSGRRLRDGDCFGTADEVRDRPAQDQPNGEKDRRSAGQNHDAAAPGIETEARRRLGGGRGNGARFQAGEQI